MSAYINKETNEYPLYEGDIRLLYPEMSKEFILPNEFAVVPESPLPDLAENEVFEEATPKLNDDGTYERVYVVRKLTEEEIKRQEEIRQEYETPRVPTANSEFINVAIIDE